MLEPPLSVLAATREDFKRVRKTLKVAHGCEEQANRAHYIRGALAALRALVIDTCKSQALHVEDLCNAASHVQLRGSIGEREVFELLATKLNGQHFSEEGTTPTGALQEMLVSAMEAMWILGDLLEQWDMMSSTSRSTTQPTTVPSGELEEEEVDNGLIRGDAESAEEELQLVSKQLHQASEAAVTPAHWPRTSMHGFIKGEVPGLIVDVITKCFETSAIEDALAHARDCTLAVVSPAHRFDAGFLFNWLARWAFLHKQGDSEAAAQTLELACAQQEDLRMCLYPEATVCLLRSHLAQSYLQSALRLDLDPLRRDDLRRCGEQTFHQMLQIFEGYALDPYVQRIVLEQVGMWKVEGPSESRFYLAEAVRLAMVPDDRANLVANFCRELAKINCDRPAELRRLLQHLRDLQDLQQTERLHDRTFFRVKIEQFRICKINPEAGSRESSKHELIATIQQFGRAFPFRAQEAEKLLAETDDD